MWVKIFSKISVLENKYAYRISLGNVTHLQWKQISVPFLKIKEKGQIDQDPAPAKVYEN